MAADLFTIRSAAADELEALLPFLRLLFTIEADFHYDHERQLRGLTLLYGDANSEILVAVDRGKIIGMVTGQLPISTSEGGPSLLVEDLVVTPKYRGQGVGRKLLEAIGNWGHTRGARRMQLLADLENLSALRFYDSISWQRTQLICLRQFHPITTK